jgi:hypothetical protein
MSDTTTRICIYPGCERPAIPPHPLGGPPGSFCDLEGHNALSAHQERQRRTAAQSGGAGKSRAKISDQSQEEVSR